MGEWEEQGDGDHHQLWVNLSALGEGNIFAVLPELMKNMLSQDMALSGSAMDVVLPSDDAWQAKIYYKLVEKQRMMDSASANDETMLDQFLNEERTPKLHDWNIIPKPKTLPCEPRRIERKASRTIELITWTVSDIAKAGCLLSSPPRPVSFEDEQEMRRVYTLIYDVFRYKNILTQALNDISFFQLFPKLVSKVPHVWLLLYDLYHRGFKQRETKYVAVASKLFDSVGLTYAENALWTQKVRLAAAVARLRIKHNALLLSELLPPHLKNEKVTEQAKNGPVTCWVNLKKIRDMSKLVEEIEQSFGIKLTTIPGKFDKTCFKWDSHCPQIIAFHASMRPKLARSCFIRDHILIIQDKSFCLGPATFGKLVADLELTGTVIQTHVNSPRTTAYLATLLCQNDKIKRLMAFSAGKRKEEYESYFQELGVTNITIFSDRLIDTPPDASYMEEVVAVFATPPNSYSAVVDPIDLVCSRGGDLSMLEVLTETDDTKEARKRIAGVLEEQNMTLRFAMSRPQIQFVLYETHSQLEEENNVMVNKALREINRVAKLHHATLQGKIAAPQMTETQSEREINNNENLQPPDGLSLSTKASSEGQLSLQSVESEQNMLEEVQVPKTDMFDQPDLPTLCPNDKCTNFEKEGCFLALLQRKEVIRLDDKYMIQMAENRGLFGSNTTTGTAKSRSSRAVKKKQEKSPEKSQRPRKKLKESETDLVEIYRDLPEYPKKHESVRTPVSTSRNILGMMTSMHIRQLVSPFCKYGDAAVKTGYKLPSDVVDKIIIVPKEMIVENSSEVIETEKIEIQEQSMQSIARRSKSRRRTLDNTRVKKMKSGLVSSVKLKKRNNKLQELLSRICTPTESSLRRSWTQVAQSSSENGKKIFETRIRVPRL